MTLLFGVMLGAAFGLAMRTLWQRVQTVQRNQVLLAEALVSLQEQDEEEPPDQPMSSAHEDALLASIVAQYGCTLTRAPSGEVYATRGTGTC